METIYKVISIMRNNKKNWEIFSKGVKNIAIVCNHIPTTPALINNRENNMKNITINFNEKEVVDLVIALNNYNTLKEKTKDLQALTSVNTILTKIKNVSQYRLNKRNKVAQ